MRISTFRTAPFKSTTSLTLCLALVMPVPTTAVAQSAERCTGLTIQLGDKPGNRAERRCLRELRREAKAAGQDVPELSEEGIAAELEAEGEAAAQAEAQAAAQAEAAAAAQAEADAAAAAQAQADANAAAEAQAQADAAAAQAAADANAAAQAQAEANAAAEAQAQADATAAQAAADANAAAQAQADAAAAAAAASAEAPKLTRKERRALARAERQAARQAEREAARAAANANAGEASVEVTEEEQIEAEIEASQEVNVIADSDAPAAAAAGSGQADVQVETVAQGDTRSATEDFQSSARGTDETREQRRARDSGDSGLSDVEKVVLFGLGALAVGAVLKNGAQVKSNSGDRVVVERDGQLFVLKDDDTLLRQPGSEVRTETFNDGSTRSTVLRPNGDQIVTIRTADGRVLRRTRVTPDGQRVLLIDDTVQAEPVRLSDIPTRRAEPRFVDTTDRRSLRAAMLEAEARDFDRGYSLAQIRQIRAVRDLVAPIDLNAIAFDTGSAAIRPAQARNLIELGDLMLDLIDENPNEVFLVEGHTDATGSAAFNLALSDRRAESVALALTEFFDVPPENLVIQGYGESNLKVRTLESEALNRRAVVRRITPLLQTAALR
jgi:outer membrane protein OmpA-like peptidoglycan-associated protein